MKSIVLLSSSENTKQVEKEEQDRFVRNILETFGIPTNDFWDDTEVLSVEGKIKLRNVLSTYNIQIIDDSDGGLKVYCDGDTIGEWKKCEYSLKKDLKQKDPSKKLYLEMKIDNWFILEDAENNE
jgi:hypothetical protein